MKRWHEGAAVLSLLLISTSVASAKRQPLDDGWLAWQGCWHAYGEPADNVLCIVPDGDGARMLTIVAGSVQSETRIIGDGSARPISLEGCNGTEKALWSKDGQRLFLSSDMMCGERTRRKVSGVMAMVSSTEFVNVQAVTSGTSTVARTIRYSAATPAKLPAEIETALRANRLARETSRYSASAAIDLDDVVEATKTVDPQVVTEWLVAMNQRFDLTGKKLVQLADAGVPASVIDMLVAVSNPEHFAVRETRDRENYAREPRGRGYDPCYDSMPYGYGYEYGYGYSRYSPGCYYSPWGYDGWGWRGGTVVVVHDGGDGGSTTHGKVTRHGYTGGGSKGTAKPRDDSQSTTRTTATSTTSNPRPASSGTDSGHASGGGYSSGSSSSGSSSTGHTAHPKDKD